MSTLLLRGTTRLPKIESPVIATIGSFDGLHYGHIALLQKVLEIKRNWQASGKHPTAIAMSFHPHPSIVLKKNPDLKLISSLRQRLEILSEFEIDIMYMLHFTPAFSRRSASDFIDNVLIKELNVDTLVLGIDAAVGYQREGDVPYITSRFHQFGRQVVPVEQILLDNQRISSESIRKLIAEGKVAQVKKLLGRNFIFDSYVIQGDERGRTIGYPTANLKRNEQIVPADGVYVTRTYISGVAYPSVTNIGFCPTFNKGERSIETHILADIQESLYSRRIQIEFLERIRDEKKFNNVFSLQEQIANDIAFVQRVYSESDGK